MGWKNIKILCFAYFPCWSNRQSLLLSTLGEINIEGGVKNGGAPGFVEVIRHSHAAGDIYHVVIAVENGEKLEDSVGKT